MIIQVVLSILVISFLWAVWSLRSARKINTHKEVAQELKKGRVVFDQNVSSSSSPKPEGVE